MKAYSVCEAALVKQQLTDVVAALEDGLARNDLSTFYQVFRTTALPFLAISYQTNARLLARFCFEILHRLGGASPAVALAIENHYYVSSAIATFPTANDPVLQRRRRALLDSIESGRLLVANTNSKVHGYKLGELGTCARHESGGFRINGKAAYASLATQGDLLLFLTKIEDEDLGIFAVAPMQGNPGIEIGPYLFPSAMIDSDTRQITFHNLFLPEECLIAGTNRDLSGMLIGFEMAWHQTLIPAIYLGAAARALDEVRLFLRHTHGRDERPLAELDGMIVDVGRLVIDYCAACSVVFQACDALGHVEQLPRDTKLLDRAVDLGSAAKYVGTRCAEATVTAARRIIGARAFTGGHPLERLSQEVIFAPLGPEVSAVIERRLGRQALDDCSFLDLYGSTL